MASISGHKCSDLQSTSPKISRLRRAKTRALCARGNLIYDYPPSIEHPRHLPRGREYPGSTTLGYFGSANRGAGGLLSSLGGVVIRIRILMYPACILQDTRILMYLDVSQTYLTCSVTLQENTCILTFCMYFTRISNEFKIHAGYT